MPPEHLKIACTYVQGLPGRMWQARHLSSRSPVFSVSQPVFLLSSLSLFLDCSVSRRGPFTMLLLTQICNGANDTQLNKSVYMPATPTPKSWKPITDNQRPTRPQPTSPQIWFCYHNDLPPSSLQPPVRSSLHTARTRLYLRSTRQTHPPERPTPSKCRSTPSPGRDARLLRRAHAFTSPVP